MRYTASMSDSEAWESTGLYRAVDTNFEPEEYVLADKAYALEMHIITPYENPAARKPANTTFNHELSKPRVKIEHAFKHAGLPLMSYRFGLVWMRSKDINEYTIGQWHVLCFIIYFTVCGMMRPGYRQKLNVSKQLQPAIKILMKAMNKSQIQMPKE